MSRFEVEGAGLKCNQQDSLRALVVNYADTDSDNSAKGKAMKDHVYDKCKMGSDVTLHLVRVFINV